jgi:tRNA (guanine37-N1)-methyltransferase
VTTTFEVFTLFPEAIAGFVGAGLLGKAVERGLVAVHCTNFRDFTTDKHRTVDDTPFGGGPGMVIKPEPVVAAIEHVERERGPMHRVLLTPSAPRFDHACAARLSELPRIGLLCGRYEGIDDRVREHFVHECVSLGDFVLGGGEVAALAMIEAISRLREGVLGNPDSAALDSFADGEAEGAWLEYPQYTRPAEFRGHAVPSVLRSGDHAAIDRWRRQTARRRTWALRPDLRSAAGLPADTPIYLWIHGARAGDPAPWIALARHHRVAGVMLVGEVDLEGWVRAAAGRPTVVVVADLRAARKRLRRMTGEAPWVVAGTRERAHDGVRSGAELMDALALQVDGAVAGRPLAVCAGIEPAQHGLAAAIRVDLTAADRSGLALAGPIADVSQPARSLATEADALLAVIRPEATATRDDGGTPDGGVP